MKIAVYTAIFGGYDAYVEPDLGSDVDLFLITDQPPVVRPKRAAVILSPLYQKDYTRSARIHKALAHEVRDYDASLWVDGSIDMVNVNLERLALDHLEGHDLAVFRHPTIRCVYEGGRYAVRCGKEDPAIMDEHLGKLRQEKYPANAGLGETGVLFRRGSAKVSEFNELWWSQIRDGSRRDQVSFNYCVERLGLRLSYINGRRQDKGFFVREHAVCL